MSVHDELLRKRALRDEGKDPYQAGEPVDANEEALADIQSRAGEVRVAHGAYEEAIMEEREAAAGLLARAIEYITPALGALGGKIERRTVKLTSKHFEHGVSTQQVSEEHHEKRGVLLADKFNAVHHERDKRGAYGGSGLYLCEDGQLAIGTRQGTWSRVPGEQSELVLSMRAVTAVEAVQAFKIELILENLKHMLGNLGGLADRAVNVRTRAAKLAVALKVMDEALRS